MRSSNARKAARTAGERGGRYPRDHRFPRGHRSASSRPQWTEHSSVHSGNGRRGRNVLGCARTHSCGFHAPAPAPPHTSPRIFARVLKCVCPTLHDGKREIRTQEIGMRRRGGVLSLGPNLFRLGVVAPVAPHDAVALREDFPLDAPGHHLQVFVHNLPAVRACKPSMPHTPTLLTAQRRARTHAHRAPRHPVHKLLRSTPLQGKHAPCTLGVADDGGCNSHHTHPINQTPTPEGGRSDTTIA